MTQASSISTPQATASQHGLLDHPLHVRRALVLLVALAALPFVAQATGQEFYIGVAARILIFALAATSLGINHRRQTMVTLFFVSILMAVSTALVGPMTFLGFLVATLAYQLADTYDHRYIFPMSVATAFIVLTGSYFVMKHVFYAQGVVSIIIELVGGGVFLLVLLRKGRL